MSRGFSFGKESKKRGSISAGEEGMISSGEISHGYTTDEDGGNMNKSRVSFDVDTTTMGTMGTMGTTTGITTGGKEEQAGDILQSQEFSKDDSPSPPQYSNTPSTPGEGMRKSLVMPMMDFSQQMESSWVGHSPPVSETPEGLGSSSVVSLEGQSPVDAEGGFRLLETVKELKESTTPEPQQLAEKSPAVAPGPDEFADTRSIAEVSEAEYSQSDSDDDDEGQSPAGSSTHLTPPTTLRKKLSARSLKTLKKKQAAERRRRKEEEARERERRGSVVSFGSEREAGEGSGRNRQGSEASFLAPNDADKQTHEEGERE